MAKKRKTRAQKESTDKRRVISPQVQSAENSSPATSYAYTYTPQASSGVSPASVKPVTTANYGFLVHDLRKTSLLTAAIIALQLILYFVIHR